MHKHFFLDMDPSAGDTALENSDWADKFVSDVLDENRQALAAISETLNVSDADEDLLLSMQKLTDEMDERSHKAVKKKDNKDRHGRKQLNALYENEKKVSELINSADLSPATIFDLSMELATEAEPKKRERTGAEKELKKQHRSRGGIKKRAKTLANELIREGIDVPSWTNYQYSKWRQKHPYGTSFSAAQASTFSSRN